MVVRLDKLYVDILGFKVRLHCFWRHIVNDVEDRFEISFLRYVIFCLKQLTIVSSAIFFTGVASIAFVVQSYTMKIAAMLSMDLIGNFR